MQFSHIKMESDLDLSPNPDQHHKSFMMPNSLISVPESNSFMQPRPKSNFPNDSFAMGDSDSDEPPMVIKAEDDPEVDFSAPRRSLYMTEKSSKKKILSKDGKIVLGKAQRKDKGKTRFTAYMLWAKETRQSIVASNPELDFSSVSKKLGEMWANVPANVKYNWKRRAKRLANKLRKNNGKLKNQEPSKYIQQKYLNKNSTNLLNSNINNNTNNHTNVSSSPSSGLPLTKQQKQLQKLMKSEKIKKQSIQNTQKQQKEQLYKKQNSSMDSTLSPQGSSHKTSPTTSGKLLLTKPSLTPIDMAAHLKLLGENLTNIGDRLKEHEVCGLFI